MQDLDQYPTLNLIVSLLSRKDEPPALTTPLPAVDEKNHTVIGELTVGERHFLAHNEHEGAALDGIRKELVDEDREPTDTENARIKHFERMTAAFWDNLRERIGGDTENVAITEGFKVVRIKIHDCGCGQGMQCGLVEAGIIDPETGERRNPSGLGGLLAGLMGGSLGVVGVSRVRHDDVPEEFRGVLKT